MMNASASRLANRIASFETLEDRRLFSAATTPVVIPPSGGGNAGGGGTVIGNDNTTVPVTIHAAAGTEFSGSVGKLKNVVLSNTIHLDAAIDWGDGSTSVGTIKQTAAGIVQINGKHTYKYGGTYHVNVSVSGRPIGKPGEPVPAFIIIYPTIQSTAIVTGPPAPPAPKPITTQGVTLNLTAKKSFTGSVGSFKLNVPTTSALLSASIDWGDNTISSGTIQKKSDGSYRVVGSHTYQFDGTFKIATTISSGPPIGPGPRPLFPTRLLGTIHSTAKVAPAPTPDGMVTLVNGVLMVRGTEQADQIDITESSPFIVTPQTGNATTPPIVSPLPPRIYVTINGHSHIVSSVGVKSVFVEGLGGNDTIDLHGAPPPVPIVYPPTAGGGATGGVSYPPTLFPFNNGLRVSAIVHGDLGDDIIRGGIANDTLFGDGGNDNLNGELGTDTLRGGSGDDLLISSAGLDKAYGGDGRDTAMLAVIPVGIPGHPFPQVYSFGYIDKDIEMILAPPVIVK
jgi:hypothetical protein